MTITSSTQGSRLPFLAYLNFAILFPVTFFQNGPARLALLAAFALCLGGLAVVRRRASLPGPGHTAPGHAAPGHTALAPAWRMVAGCLLFGAVPAAVLFLSLGSPNKVRIWEAGVALGLVAAIVWCDTFARRGRERLFRGMPWYGLLLVGLAFSVPLLNLASGLLVPKLSDVATTTLDAARILAQGHNPYAASLDPYGVSNAHDPAFGGYKYLPLMILLHLPLAGPLGPMAVLWVNAACVAGLCGVVWGLSRGARTGDRLIAVALLLATPELAETALAMGYNDSIGTLLALTAFLVRGRSALLAGLLVGCSMSCKLMPGLVAATIVFPPDRWKSYAAGMAAGLLPTVLFLAWDPDAFIRNVLLFNLVRSPDGTSWRLFAPAWLGRVASLAALGFWLAGSAWLAWRSRNANSSTGAEGCPVRLALFVAVTLGLIMTGSTAHDDYMIWWMPAVLAIIPLEIGLGRRTAQRAG